MASNEDISNPNQLFDYNNTSSLLAMLNNSSVENFVEWKPQLSYSPSENIGNNCIVEFKREESVDMKHHQSLYSLDTQQVFFIISF